MNGIAREQLVCQLASRCRWEIYLKKKKNKREKEAGEKQIIRTIYQFHTRFFLSF